tara:strand:- start:107 stop:520 length:414 start_codon:yes stop_codon:yes gene_type:complete
LGVGILSSQYFGLHSFLILSLLSNLVVNAFRSVEMNSKNMTLSEQIQILVDSLDGAEKTNEALSKCPDGDSMADVLLAVSKRLKLDLTKDDLMKTPPIRDWIWWKNKEALLTLGGGTPRHKQDQSLKKRNFFERIFR